ncbi:hypothetical protein LXA43DRAFT_502168 [Ganoderma leucocontextum]|nr:hypothetical protein LXA43DRAFT_502168 [Ganoderma leucocontextum]
MLGPALVSVLLFPVLWVSPASAQATDATCLSEYAWMTNSLGQSPCWVTAWLYVPCWGSGESSHVNKLTVGSPYTGPWKAQGPQCECNTVIYSTLAACGICQIGDVTGVQAIEKWPMYSTNCSTTYNETYPWGILGGTAVPEWAFLDVISNGTFNLDAAKALALQNLPDITSGSSATPTSSTLSSTSGAPASSKSTSGETGTHSQDISPTATQTSPSVEQSSSNFGAIVGGSIGGVVGLLLVGALVLYIILRHRRQTRRDQILYGLQATEAREVAGSEPPSYHVPTLKGEAGSLGALYDPDDPRTYPVAQTTQNAGVGYTGLPQVMS